MPLRLPSGLSPRHRETAAAVPDGARCAQGPGVGPGPGGLGPSTEDLRTEDLRTEDLRTEDLREWLGPRTEAAGGEEAGGWAARAAHGPGGLPLPGTRHNLALSDTPTGAPGADREKPRLVEKGGPAHGLVVSDNV